MHKQSYLFALTVIIAFIGLVVADSGANDTCGDANGDGSVNVSDAVWIINYVFVGGDPPVSNCCDNCPPTMTDIDGNVYQTVQIGCQCWMAENLKVIRYRNGDPLSSWWYYANDEGNDAVYGKLYNWYVINDSRNIAPEGWHVPNDCEWQMLIDYLGGDAVAGGKMKETGTAHWLSPNTGATNESGFTGLPGGQREVDGSFSQIGEFAYFWSCTEHISDRVWIRYLFYSSSEAFRFSCPKQMAISIRCVKDY